MKKFYSLIVLLALAALPAALSAQNVTVELGNGETTSNSSLPSYSFYNYSLTQQIYWGDEIGVAGIINSIAFYNSGSTKTRSFDIYLATTNK